MAIVDWFITKTNPGIDVELELDIPINGTGSLRITQDAIAATEPVANAHVRPLAGPPQSRFLKGKVRTLIQPKQVTDSATSVTFMGALGMMSQPDVFFTDSAGGGKAYFAGRWGGATPNWWIARVDGGVTGAGDFVALSGATGSTLNLPGINDIRAIEFEWVYDPIMFGGVRLTLSAAPDDDFGNLVQIYQVVDTSASALNSTVGEGLFLSTLHTVTGPVVETLYDKTILFELVPV